MRGRTGEWGPWIWHDGRGCPVVGQFVERVLEAQVPGARPARFVEYSRIGIVPGGMLNFWDWSTDGPGCPLNPGFRAPRIIRYRVRRPLGLCLLEAIAAAPCDIVPA